MYKIQDFAFFLSCLGMTLMVLALWGISHFLWLTSDSDAGFYWLAVFMVVATFASGYEAFKGPR